MGRFVYLCIPNNNKKWQEREKSSHCWRGWQLPVWLPKERRWRRLMAWHYSYRLRHRVTWQIFKSPARRAASPKVVWCGSNNSHPYGASLSVNTSVSVAAASGSTSPMRSSCATSSSRWRTALPASARWSCPQSTPSWEPRRPLSIATRWNILSPTSGGSPTRRYAPVRSLGR